MITRFIFPLLIIFLSCTKAPDTDYFTHTRSMTTEEVESYIHQKEAQLTDIRSGLQKEIIWNTPDKQKSEFSIVYIHGFSATRKEIYPVCDILAKQFNANLYYTRLKGHGRHKDSYIDITMNDWLEDGMESLGIGRAIGHNIILIGTSTGAPVIKKMLEYTGTDQIAGIIWLSPNFGPADKNSSFLTLPLGKYIARITQGTYRSYTPRNNLQAHYWDTEYHSYGLVPMMQTVKSAIKTDFIHFPLPLLILYNPLDKVVDQSITVKLFNTIQSENKVLIEARSSDPSKHLLAGEALSPDTTEETVKTIANFISNYVIKE